MTKYLRQQNTSSLPDSVMEFLSVHMVLVFSLSFANLPGVHSVSVLVLKAAHCYSESLDWPVCQILVKQLCAAQLDLRQLGSYQVFMGPVHSVHAELH